MAEILSNRIRVIAGLGNPGRKYEKTRHNVGFMVVDELVRRWNIHDSRGAFGGMLYETRIERGDENFRVFLLKPHTYMNHSGQAVKGLMSFFKVDPADMLVVLDDFALKLGRVRVRAKGSAGGHNGLSDVIRHMSTNEISRLRIGIGSAPEYMQTADFVLQRFSAEDISVIQKSIKTAADAVEDWIFYGTVYVMDNYNNKDGSLKSQ